MFNLKGLCKGTISTTLKRGYLLLCFGLFGSSIGLHASNFPFPYGIASGDADATSVVLWTRLDIAIALPHQVKWELSGDQEFAESVESGVIFAEQPTVKVLIDGLSRGWYYYRFTAAGYTSAPGRTFISGNNADDVSFAAFSCADYQRGYFNAYQAALEQNDFHYLLFLGDYYYDNAPVDGAVDIQDRSHLPPFLPRSEEDFRRRWQQYRSDPMLQQLHRNYGSYAIWDDHEFADDCWRDGGEGVSGSEWEMLKANAKAAWYEWMPVRDRSEDYVSRRVGPVKLILTESRINGRDEVLEASAPGVDDENRTLLGYPQEGWLNEELNQDVPWNVLCSGVPLMPQLYQGVSVRPHAWDGYPAARQRMKEAVVASAANFCVLSGDMHAARVADLPLENYDASNQENSWGVEVTAPPVTSIVRTVTDSIGFRQENPHIQYMQESHRGFVKVRFTDASMFAQFFWVDDVLNSGDYASTEGPVFEATTEGYAFQPAPDAGFMENDVSVVLEQTSQAKEQNSSLRLFPNPAADRMLISVYLEMGDHRFSIYTPLGQKVRSWTYRSAYRGEHQIVVDTRTLGPASYVIQMDGVTGASSEQFIVIE